MVQNWVAYIGHSSVKWIIQPEYLRTGKTGVGCRPLEEAPSCLQIPKDCRVPKTVTWRERFLLNINRNFLIRRWRPWERVKLLPLNSGRGCKASSGWQSFTVKCPRVNIFGFAGHMIPRSTGQLCQCSKKAITDNT